jgi:peptide/nickel transport system substrate-binding protein
MFKKRRRSKITLAVLGVATIAATIIGCGSSGSATAGSTTSILKWSGSLPPGWDPVTVTNVSASYYQALVYAPLVDINEKGQPVPGLAQSWTFNKTGTAITFHLRPGGEFSDGELVDAQAIKDYFVRAKTQANSGRIEDYESIKSVTVDSEWDVTLNLASPDFQIPLELSTKGALITAPNASKNPTYLANHPVGAGPFEVTSFVPDSHIYLKKNPNYWDAKDIHIDEVELFPQSDTTTAVSAVATGTYNFATIGTQQIKQADSTKGVTAYVPTGTNISYISMNTKVAPFNNPAVVQAVHYAINRQQLFEDVSYGIGQIAGEVFVKGSPGYVASSDESGQYNPALAKQILAKAGIKPGQIKFPISLDGTSDQAAAELVQQQLEAVGIDPTIDSETDSTYRTQLYDTKSLAFTVFGGHNYDSDAETLGAFFGADGRYNLSGTQPPGFAAALTLVRETPLDSPEYAARLQAATKLGMEEPSHIFFSTYVLPFVQSDKISPLQHIPDEVDWQGVTISS